MGKGVRRMPNARSKLTIVATYYGFGHDLVDAG